MRVKSIISIWTHKEHDDICSGTIESIIPMIYEVNKQISVTDIQTRHTSSEYTKSQLEEYQKIFFRNIIWTLNSIWTKRWEELSFLIRSCFVCLSWCFFVCVSPIEWMNTSQIEWMNTFHVPFVSKLLFNRQDVILCHVKKYTLLIKNFSTNHRAE